MPTLSIGQYDMVYNALSFTIAAMGAGFVFFLLARGTVAFKYQRVLEIAAIIVAIACYHYFRMFSSWTSAFTHDGANFKPTNELFNEAYRYADWLLTVPLLLVELLTVIYVVGKSDKNLSGRLIVAAALMILLGYPGEIASDMTTRFIWGTLSSIPFVYIVATLWREVGTAMARESEEVRGLLFTVRLVILASWGVYPIAYLLPLLHLSPDVALVGKQVGYSIADIIAKPAYGLLIYAIARVKTREEQAAAPAGAKIQQEGIIAPA